METDLYVNENLTIPGRELWAAASLSSGPGGQHVNKVSSRITLYWQVVASSAVTADQRKRIMDQLAGRISTEGVLQVNSDTHRSQHRNRELAREKMAVLVANALKIQTKRLPTRMSIGVRRRRLNAKRQRGQVKSLRRAPLGDRE